MFIQFLTIPYKYCTFNPTQKRAVVVGYNALYPIYFMSLFIF